MSSMLRLVLKNTLFGSALLLATPLIVATWLEGALVRSKSERIYGACKEILAPVPSLLGRYLRATYYWACCTKVSPDVCLLLGSMIAHRRTVIGSRVLIGSYCIIGHAEIGDDVLISSRVSIVSGRYQHGRPEERAAAEPISAVYETIRVGRNSWIGEGAVILANVGENCTIAAGAVLYRDAPDDATFLGNPARRVDLVTRAEPASQPLG
jgi:acetyltransferase-like isoleucine patch superfamily enzyme